VQAEILDMNHSASESPGGLASALAAQLLDLIVRGQHAAGHRLREQALADELGVSRSPVRKALQYLEELGAVGYEMNRGFFLSKESAALREFQLPGSDESDEAHYMRIAEDRLTEILPVEVCAFH